MTSYSRTPLHLAALRGHSEVVRMLMSKGANPNSLDLEQCTPLHYVSENGFLEVLHYLLHYHFDKIQFQLTNSKLLTAYEVSANHKIKELFENFNVGLDAHEGYQRVQIGRCILRNGRADHVQKMLNLTK